MRSAKPFVSWDKRNFFSKMTVVWFQASDTSILLDLLSACILRSNIAFFAADDTKFETVTRSWKPSEFVVAE